MGLEPMNLLVTVNHDSKRTVSRIKGLGSLQHDENELWNVLDKYSSAMSPQRPQFLSRPKDPNNA